MALEKLKFVSKIKKAQDISIEQKVEKIKNDNNEINEHVADAKIKRLRYFNSLVIPVIISVIAASIFSCFFGFNVISGKSMQNTLHDGQVTFYKKFNLNKVEKGDIVIFKNNYYGDSEIIKRVIAVAGDTIEIDGTEVILNNEVLKESYVSKKNFKEESFTGKITVPEGYVYVLGDNRDNSADSRVCGVVAIDDLVGILVKHY